MEIIIKNPTYGNQDIKKIEMDKTEQIQGTSMSVERKSVDI